MAKTSPSASAQPDPDAPMTRARLIERLNEDLVREYQAIIVYIVYSQVLKGAAYMSIAKELDRAARRRAARPRDHHRPADRLSGGGTPVVTPVPVKMSKKATDLLRFDLQNESDTIRNYRERVKQCELLGEFAIAEHIREILKQEQEHLIDLATALGEDPPDVSKRR